MRDGLMRLAREHLKEDQEFSREYASLRRRWRRFKRPQTRPKNAQFWIVVDPVEPLNVNDGWLRRVNLTDDSNFETLGRAQMVVTIRPFLEELEEATGDSWHVTAERDVYEPPRPTITAAQLVKQAYHQYAITDGRSPRTAPNGNAPAEENSHANNVKEKSNVTERLVPA
jgi:hypothetical protein